MAVTYSKLLMSVPRPHRIISPVVVGYASFGAPTFHASKLKLKCFGAVTPTTNPSDTSNDKDYEEIWELDGIIMGQLQTWNCIGSSHGWLGYINPRDLSFYLFKPSLRGYKYILPYIILPPIRFAAENPNAISKMVLSSCPEPISRTDPRHNSANKSIWVVTTLDWHGPAAAFCRIGYDKWATLNNFPEDDETCSKTFQDITYCEKRKLFYVATDSGKIYSWDLSTHRTYPLTLHPNFYFRYLAKAPLHKFNPEILKSREEIVNSKYYLVVDDSFGSLMVIRLHISYECYMHSYPNNNKRREKRYMHHIHRLDLGRLEWFKVKDLANACLFIGRNNGVVVDASIKPGSMMPGHIYLACNADNVFQLTALPVWNVEGVSEDYNLLCAYTISTNQMTSFLVWNFEI